MGPDVAPFSWSLSPHSSSSLIEESLPQRVALNQTPPEPLKLLLVSPSAELQQSLGDRLPSSRWQLMHARSGSEAIEKLLQERADVMLVGAYLPDLDPAEFRFLVERQFPGMEVLSVGEAGAISAAVFAQGASGHPLSDLGEIFRPAGLPLPLSAAMPPLGLLRPSLGAKGHGWGGLIGASSAMQRVYRAAQLVARRDTSVLILGESGTGKDLVAKAIHNASARDKQPFVVINCAAIPEPLLEAELFGYTKGAFTGAAQSRIGRIHAAHGGTLFLDEIGDMPFPLQSKILRFLEQGEVQRIGGSDTLKVDCRVLAATNADLKKLAKQNQFREDLFYRLAVFPISLPPLRSRMEDLDLLVESFVSRFCPGAALSPEARQMLHSYNWPGNVRELRNVLERASVFAEDRSEIVADDILLC